MTVINPPREHHFVPQFWLKRFKDADGCLYGYDRQRQIVTDFSPRRIMKIRDLYTLDPDGIDDTSIEDVDLKRVDNNGAVVMARLLDGDRSLEAKSLMADFIAVQVMRDPQQLADYAPVAKAFLTSLFVEAQCSNSFEYFDRALCGAVPQEVYDHLRTLGPDKAAVDIAEIQLALERKGGLPSSPFTDLIRDHGGLDIIRKELLQMNWTLLSAPEHSFVLGDHPVLFQRGAFGERVVIPLSGAAALTITRSALPTAEIGVRSAHPHEPSHINLESAARARRWIVGAQKQVDALEAQVSGPTLPENA